jgi:hypothetical protein
MEVTLSWLVGQTLQSCEKTDYTWGFTFANGGKILTESTWRLITKTGTSSSEDHEQLFGLTQPVDAGKGLIEMIQNKKIISYKIKKLTSDLVIEFEDEIRVEFLVLSGGYESWRTDYESEQVVCAGGGRLAVYRGNDRVRYPTGDTVKRTNDFVK